VVTDNLKLIVMKIIEFNGKPNRNFHDILDFAKVGISEISQIPPGEKLGLEKYRKSHLAKSWDSRYFANPNVSLGGIRDISLIPTFRLVGFAIFR